jgi:hypothetical protein
MYFAGEAQIVSRQFLEEQYLVGFIVFIKEPAVSRLVEEESEI